MRRPSWSKQTDQQWDDSLELLHYFTIEGKHGDDAATPGQVEIFGCIVHGISDRLHIMTCTQYGKSLFVALACIVLSCMVGELVTVLAPTDEKASIIMRYYLDHIGDSIMFHQQLNKATRLERLQMETTKDRVVLRNKGGIFILSVQGGNSKKGFQAAMGEGSKIVILDEACLTPDDQESTVFRMGAGKVGFQYVKIGNPFYKDPPNSHFWKSSRDPNYVKISIDYNQALEEGRYRSDFIAEAKGKPLFSVLYENKFPAAAVQDKSGYYQLIPEKLMDMASLPEGMTLPLIGEKKMGIDIAGGGRNKSAITIRGDNVAMLAYHHETADPLVLITELDRIAKEHDIPIDDEHVFPDKTGAIAFCARMNELYPTKKDGSPNSFGTTVGGRPEEDDDPTKYTLKQSGDKDSIYLNVRAQISFRTQEWLQAGGKIDRANGGEAYDDSANVRYKVQSDKKLKIKSKEEMSDEGIESPDAWDSLALTFSKKRKAAQKVWKQKDVHTDEWGNATE